jgi:hypothetical protein
MAFRGEQVTVGTAAVELTALAEADTTGGRSLAITTVTVDVFLGATSAVTTSTGAKIPSGSGIGFDLSSGDHVWAIAAGAGTAHVVEVGV